MLKKVLDKGPQIYEMERFPEVKNVKHKNNNYAKKQWTNNSTTVIII